MATDIWLCIKHGFMPPMVERYLYGSVHYRPWSYWKHLRVNIREALDILHYALCGLRSKEKHRGRGEYAPTKDSAPDGR